MSKNLCLIEPDPLWQSAFFEMANEFVVTGDLRYQAAITDFTIYLQRLEQFARADKLPPGRVRETTYWGIEGRNIVGCSRLRHALTPTLQQLGGHIGYDIRPSKRRQGYGTALLASTLIHAQQVGLMGVLITCDTANIGSVRVIEKNGGQRVAQAKVDGYPHLISRYWIDLTTARSTTIV